VDVGGFAEPRKIVAHTHVLSLSPLLSNIASFIGIS